MNIKCKYNVGDKVYRIESANMPLSIPRLICPACNGTGEVKLGNNQVARCAAVFQVFGNECTRYFCEKGNLSKNEWTTYADKYPYEIKTIVAYYDANDAEDISYEVSCGDTMLEVPESRLFATYEEAQAEADRINSKSKQEVA